jgi:hypothetical protein
MSSATAAMSLTLLSFVSSAGLSCSDFELTSAKKCLFIYF